MVQHQGPDGRNVREIWDNIHIVRALSSLRIDTKISPELFSTVVEFGSRQRKNVATSSLRLVNAPSGGVVRHSHLRGPCCIHLVHGVSRERHGSAESSGCMCGTMHVRWAVGGLLEQGLDLNPNVPSNLQHIHNIILNHY